MSAVLNFNTVMVPEECCNCGVKFAVTTDFQRRRRDMGGSFYCPNGHAQHYTKTEVQRLKEQLEEVKRRAEWNQAEAATLKRSLTAKKGQITKMKNRISKGVCPCCNRTFENLARHMNTQHPDYTVQDEN